MYASVLDNYFSQGLQVVIIGLMTRFSKLCAPVDYCEDVHNFQEDNTHSNK